MTIKEFAKLCGCNAQTLRYYDRIDLLKPVKVDAWSGYRYYDEEQAILFVKIKNLQLAGFSIDEIKSLIDEDDARVYEAFEEKISEQKEKLEAIMQIQKSYQNEMNTMREKIRETQARVQAELENYNPEEEFGIDEATYNSMIQGIISVFEEWEAEGNYEDYELTELENDEEKREDHYDFFDNPAYEIVCEKHGWQFAKEFLPGCLELPDSADYNYVFKLTDEKQHNSAFPNIVLALVLSKNEKNPEHKRNLGCTVTNSDDGQNHFWLFRKK